MENQQNDGVAQTLESDSDERQPASALTDYMLALQRTHQTYDRAGLPEVKIDPTIKTFLPIKDSAKIDKTEIIEEKFPEIEDDSHEEELVSQEPQLKYNEQSFGSPLLPTEAPS